MWNTVDQYLLFVNILMSIVLGVPHGARLSTKGYRKQNFLAIRQIQLSSDISMVLLCCTSPYLFELKL